MEWAEFIKVLTLDKTLMNSAPPPLSEQSTAARLWIAIGEDVPQAVSAVMAILNFKFSIAMKAETACFRRLVAFCS